MYLRTLGGNDIIVECMIGSHELTRPHRTNTLLFILNNKLVFFL